VKRIDALLADYASHHRTRGNLVCHAFGITLIVFGLISFLREVGLGGDLTLAEAVIAVAFLYYLVLDLPLALAFLGEAILLDVLARVVGDWRVGLAAFVVGWILQGIGHARFEKRSPAFFKNLIHLMVGPVFLLNELLGIRPVAALSEPAK
jgi:uncharacterized membrane protein YGL010W